MCVHHYLVGEQVAGVAPGVCKKCGAERQFVVQVAFDWTISPARMFGKGGDRYEDRTRLAEELA